MKLSFSYLNQVLLGCTFWNDYALYICMFIICLSLSFYALILKLSLLYFWNMKINSFFSLVLVCLIPNITLISIKFFQFYWVDMQNFEWDYFNFDIILTLVILFIVLYSIFYFSHVQRYIQSNSMVSYVLIFGVCLTYFTPCFLSYYFWFLSYCIIFVILVDLGYKKTTQFIVELSHPIMFSIILGFFLLDLFCVSSMGMGVFGFVLYIFVDLIESGWLKVLRILLNPKDLICFVTNEEIKALSTNLNKFFQKNLTKDFLSSAQFPLFVNGLYNWEYLQKMPESFQTLNKSVLSNKGAISEFVEKNHDFSYKEILFAGFSSQQIEALKASTSTFNTRDVHEGFVLSFVEEGFLSTHSKALAQVCVAVLLDEFVIAEKWAVVQQMYPKSSAKIAAAVSASKEFHNSYAIFYSYDKSNDTILANSMAKIPGELYVQRDDEIKHLVRRFEHHDKSFPLSFKENTFFDYCVVLDEGVKAFESKTQYQRSDFDFIPLMKEENYVEDYDIGKALEKERRVVNWCRENNIKQIIYMYKKQDNLPPTSELCFIKDFIERNGIDISIEVVPC